MVAIISRVVVGHVMAVPLRCSHQSSRVVPEAFIVPADEPLVAAVAQAPYRVNSTSRKNQLTLPTIWNIFSRC
ncbi:MAG: hypothetical protein ONB51_10140 [candidate division KSB1 bacterium]|nr:hypothetical protein [candidate division KSB1 bacterium]MDZ7409584.1 hypothetical protein [candidate division KSB1 bacterium]